MFKLNVCVKNKNDLKRIHQILRPIFGKIYMATLDDMIKEYGLEDHMLMKIVILGLYR